jgi:hypothetical protein
MTLNSLSTYKSELETYEELLGLNPIVSDINGNFVDIKSSSSHEYLNTKKIVENSEGIKAGTVTPQVTTDIKTDTNIFVPTFQDEIRFGVYIDQDIIDYETNPVMQD